LKVPALAPELFAVNKTYTTPMRPSTVLEHSTFPPNAFLVCSSTMESLGRFAGPGLVEWEINSPLIPWSLRPGDGGQIRNPDSFPAESHHYPKSFFTP
jgi:hypothetical protein